jgi:hypothetical protein
VAHERTLCKVGFSVSPSNGRVARINSPCRCFGQASAFLGAKAFNKPYGSVHKGVICKPNRQQHNPGKSCFGPGYKDDNRALYNSDYCQRKPKPRMMPSAPTGSRSHDPSYRADAHCPSCHRMVGEKKEKHNKIGNCSSSHLQKIEQYAFLISVFHCCLSNKPSLLRERAAPAIPAESQTNQGAGNYQRSAEEFPAACRHLCILALPDFRLPAKSDFR